jgi:hypothetical protein
MKRFSVVRNTDGGIDKGEAWAKRVVTFMGLIGPVTLVGLLLWIVHWDAFVNVQTVLQEYFPSHYVNVAWIVEDRIRAF